MEFVEGMLLTHRSMLISSMLITAFIIGVFSVSHASDSIGVASASVVRPQLQSIADEVVVQAKLDPKERVVLSVEGEGPRSLTENAFIDALQKRNFVSVLNTGTTSAQMLHISLLSADVKVKAVDEKYSERDVSVALEARTIVGMEREVHLIGTFQRETKDTAQVFPVLQLSQSPEDEEQGMFQRLMTPLIIISGAILIVYLLFTVRS